MCPHCGQPFGVGPNCQYCGAQASAANRRAASRGWAFGVIGLVAALVAGLVIWRVADPASTAGSAVGGSQTTQLPPTVPSTVGGTMSAPSTDSDPSGTESTPSSADPSESSPPTAETTPSTNELSPPSTQSGGVPPNSTDSTGTSGSAPPSSAKSTLTVGLFYLPADPDPAVGSDGTPAILWRQVFDTLTTYTGKSPKPVADLATSWQSSNNAKQWTFKIAAGKKFHDGSAVTAKAVCDNYDFWNSATGEKQQQLGDWGYFFYGFKGQSSDRYSSCKASGDSAVMTFSKPMPSLPDIVSQITFSIHSPASLRGTKPVGSGPYKWVSGTEQRVELAAVAPGITPMVTMIAISDPQDGADAVETGRADLYYSLTPDRPTVQSGATIAAPPADQLATIDLLGAKGPLADATARSAIMAALDTKKITQLVGTNPTKSPLPGVFNGPPLAVPTFNVAAAKKLLQGKKIGTLVMELRGGDALAASDLQIGQLIKSQLAVVGVTVKLVVAPSVSAYYTAIQDGKSDLWVARTQAYSGDLLEIADAYAHGAIYQAAVPATSKAAFDTKMNSALDGSDPAARSSLSIALLDQLVAEHSVLPLFSYGGSWVVSDAVYGFRTTAFNQVQLQGVTVH